MGTVQYGIIASNIHVLNFLISLKFNFEEVWLLVLIFSLLAVGHTSSALFCGCGLLGVLDQPREVLKFVTALLGLGTGAVILYFIAKIAHKCRHRLNRWTACSSIIPYIAAVRFRGGYWSLRYPVWHTLSCPEHIFPWVEPECQLRHGLLDGCRELIDVTVLVPQDN